MFHNCGKLIPVLVLVLCPVLCFCQPAKQTRVMGETWFGTYNQTRFSKRWGMWFDAQLCTREKMVNGFFQSEIRPGVTYYVNDSTRITTGYTFQNNYPFDGHKNISQPEHRIWHQVQWTARSRHIHTSQYLRLEERWVRKVANDSTLATGSQFTFRARYNFALAIPIFLHGNQTPWSISVSDEAFVNFGKNVVYNYFDQNRFFTGLTYRFTPLRSLQVGYLNLFQQLPSGNRYRQIHAIRIYYFHNIDLRRRR